MYDASINWDLYGAWMILKDLPKFQSVPGDVDVLERSSISEGRGVYWQRKKRLILRSVVEKV
jgi:hypothetical protein